MTRSDEELLRAHLAGDRTAFYELVERHRRLLWSLARRRMDSHEDAEEVVSDTWCRAHQRAAQYRADAAVSTWLVKILYNACNDRYRWNRVRPSIPVSATELADLPGRRDPIGEVEMRIDIDDALRQLPQEQRAAVLLVYVHGYPTAEAAYILDVPAGTVKSRCARGRARLDELLTPAVGARTGETP